MKRLIIVLLPAILFGCSQPETQHNVSIQGVVTNPTTDYIFIKGFKELKSAVVDSILTDNQGTHVIGFSIIDKNGHFSSQFSIEEAGLYKFTHGRSFTLLYLTPGDNISLSVDASDYDNSMRFEGTGGKYCQYFAEKDILKNGFPLNDREMYSLTEERFIVYTDSTKTVMESSLNDYCAANAVDHEKFKRLTQEDIKYSWLEQRGNFPSYHQHYTHNDTITFDDAYHDFFEQVDTEAPELLELASYQKVVKSYINRKTALAFEADSSLKELDNSFITEQFNQIKEHLNNQEVMNFLYASLISDHIKYSGVYRTENLIAEYKSNCTNQEYIENLERVMHKWEGLAEGNNAPPFEFADTSGQMFSMADFKGKYIYLDVWATWCGPCKKEFPHLKKLEKEFEGKNIVFVSVSVDNTSDPWVNMVGEKKLGGVQLWAGGFKGDWTDAYKIKSIPRFILVDREGKLITASAPRPSGNIKGMLEKLDGLEG